MGKIKHIGHMLKEKAALPCLVLVAIALALSGCEQPDNTVSSVISITSVNGLTIIEHDAEENNTLQLKATITSSGSSPEFLYWSSSNKYIAEVNQNGEVYLPTGNCLYGYVEIIAETIDGGRGSIKIFVVPQGGYIEDEDGTWKIYTADGLLTWNEQVTTNSEMGVNVKLMANITLPDPEKEQTSNWTPVGTTSNKYTGTFDGNYHTISNLEIVSKDINYVELFGYIGENGSVKNLTLSDVEISGKQYVGGIAGVNYGTIENCSVSGTIEGSSWVGGIAGVNYGTIENCSVSGTVSGEYYVGGIAGTNRNIITACYNTGTVQGLSDVGGIVGYNLNNDSNNGAITACYNTGDIESSSDDYVGGVIGSNSATVTACYWTVPDEHTTISGIGAGSTSETVKKVGENDVTWETAMNEMNTVLSGYGYEYTKNTDSTTNDTMPLIIKSSN